MNHLESGFKGRNSLWRYFLMIISVFIASNTIGALPLLASLVLRSLSNPDVFSTLAASTNDYSGLGLGPNLLLVIMLFPFMAGLAAFILLVRPLHSRTFMSVINGTTGMRWKRFFLSYCIWMILSALYLILYMKADPANFSLINSGKVVVVLAVISLLLIPFQAALEEVLFRGYLMQGFAVLLGNRWLPVIITSVLFGLLHGINPEVKEYGFFAMMPQYIVFGLIFGIVTILDDGTEIAMGAHAANNAFLCVLVTNKSSALQTAAIYEQAAVRPSVEFLALVLFGIIFIFILKKLLNWKDLSVLTGRVQKPKLSDPVDGSPVL